LARIIRRRKLRPDVEKAAHSLAMKKLADKYVGRRGEPPSLSSRRAAQRNQDLNDDDRKHLKWCLDIIRNGLLRHDAQAQADAHAALDFIVAVLDRDYNLYVERKLRGDP
jgi:hypothetical protein